MDLERARYLVSGRGQSALASLDPCLADLAPHQLANTLRRDHSPGEAAALAEQVTLRARARARSDDDRGFIYSLAGLEMMTHPLVAARRAARLTASSHTVTDLTCGIGGDLSAVAAIGARAFGLDRDPVAALLAAANVPAAWVAVGDARAAPFHLTDHAVVLDPSRRTGIRRRFDPNAFSPPWPDALAIASAAKMACIKGPPGLDLAQVPPQAEIEFVQLGKGLREAALWFGQGSLPGLRRAVLLPGDITLTSAHPEAPAGPVPPDAVIFDPESCVTRAGLVRHLAAGLGGRLMDPQIAYLTAPTPASHPMADAFEVLESVPFSLGRLKQRLRENRWRPDQIRRRAFPVEPDELRRLLGKMEGEPVTLLCTTLGGRRLVFVAREIRRSTERGLRL